MRRTLRTALATLLTLLSVELAGAQTLAGFDPPAPLNSNAATDSGKDMAARAATDGAGLWLAVWESNDNLGGSIGGDSDVLVARSLDSGASWTAATPLASNAYSDDRDDNLPQIATDGLGTWVVVWYSRTPLGGTIGTDRDIFFARSTDGGISWSDPAPLNTNASTDSGDDDNPQIATDGLGNWIAIWVSRDNLGQTIGTDEDILVARSSDAGASWSAPAPLNSNASRAERMDNWPRIATDGQGTWITVWESREGHGDLENDPDILVSRSHDAGASWEPSSALNSRARNDRAGDFTPTIATDGQGLWIAVWVHHKVDRDGGGTDAEIEFSRSQDQGTTWSDKARLHPNNQRNDWWPEITTDGGGIWAVVWFGKRNEDQDILLARSNSGGTSWTKPEPLNTNAVGDSKDDRFPFIVTDGVRWITVWESNSRLGSTIGDDRDILVATNILSQTETQQKCTNGHNKAASRLVRSREKQALGCARDVVNATGQLFQDCLDTEPPSFKDVKRCAGVDAGGVSATPQFGVASTASSESAALAEPVDLASDLFGADLDATLDQPDPVDARCQQKVLGDAYGISDVLWKQLRKGKKSVLAGRDFDGSSIPPPESTQELSDDLTQWLAADPKGRVTRAGEKLPAAIARACADPKQPPASPLPSLFPGDCAAAAGMGTDALASCTFVRARCRFCEQLDATDDLLIDCDDFDDASANGSCTQSP